MIDDREIAFIVAMTPERVIGVKGGLPWHISEDLRYFKEKTLGHAMIMGRKTFESLGGVLPDRHHIIISRAGFEHAECHVCDSPEQALQVALSVSGGMIYVIGGGEIFRMMYDLADRLYVTEVDMDISGDTYFPEIGKGGEGWVEHAGDWQVGVDKHSGNEVRYRFVEYIRKAL